MARFDRLPAIPLIASDPYISYWMPADDMTTRDSAHWAGETKPIRGTITVDGKAYRFLGAGDAPAAAQTSQVVTPCSTVATFEAAGVLLTLRFTTPAFPDDLDLLSTPATFVTVTCENADGAEHDVVVRLFLSDRLCYDGEARPNMFSDAFDTPEGNIALMGQMKQKPLSGSGDHITIDWGYLYLASASRISCGEDGLALTGGMGTTKAVIFYDDIASINYFGTPVRAWYLRNGGCARETVFYLLKAFDAVNEKADKWDEKVLSDAAPEGNDYVAIVSAAWRHVFAAHKLVVTPEGEMAYLSKENDSNGCIGTVDVSYPSIPLFLKYAPALVNALALPVLEFANMPVWSYDFAPHDVGRYPNAIGQVYAARRRRETAQGEAFPPFFNYPAGADAYDDRYQMPVEESGNMLVMLEAARVYGAPSLAEVPAYRAEIDKWVRYLIEYGEDPGEQLCTDDFAGHLAHNANLAAKAIVGVACYARLTGQPAYMDKAKEMAGRLLEKLGTKGDAPLVLNDSEGKSWSMKYNLLWDRVFDLGLFPDDFYENETKSYLKRMNRYGLPLDSRADYTKSDWICWTAALSFDPAVRAAFFAPIALYLRESGSRVAFSDWYNTKTGLYEHFIARSVQGGLFAPLLTQDKVRR